ncbi:MAG TPA: TIR domain-containing protein [Nocardioidaceae bacterium]|nr:TIR domain-containing protein [Nocardioidaceae bacterium]
MADEKVVFLAFAKEDETTKILFLGQRKLTSTPYSWTDMSVKEPYDSEWKARVRTRVRRSDGVIALISSSTPDADGQLWEIACAVEEEKPLLGVWIEKGYRTKPTEMAGARCVEWTWENVGNFISSL